MSHLRDEQFVKEMTEVLGLLGGIVSVIHPELYEIGWRYVDSGILNTEFDFELRSVFCAWAGPFTHLWTTGNEDIELHRSTNRDEHHCYDIELSLGEGEGRLEVESVGLTFRHNSGTVVAKSPCLLNGTSNGNNDRTFLCGHFDVGLLMGSGFEIPSWMTEQTFAARMGIDLEGLETVWYAT